MRRSGTRPRAPRARGRRREAPRRRRTTCGRPEARRRSHRPPALPARKPVGQAGHRDREQDEQQRGGEVRRVVEAAVDLDLRLPEGLHGPDQRDKRGVLLQADEVVQKRREDDEPERPSVRQAERARRRRLTRMNGLDAGAIDLADVGGVDEDERDDSPEEGRARHAGEVERRDCEPEEEDHQDRRHPAEEVRVDDGEQPQREEHGPAQAAEDGEHEADDQDEDLRDQEDLHVHEQLRRDLRQRLAEDLAVEEARTHLRPSRRVDDDEDEGGEEDDGAHRRDQRAAEGTAPEDAGPAAAGGGYSSTGALPPSHFCWSRSIVPSSWSAAIASFTQSVRPLSFFRTTPKCSPPSSAASRPTTVPPLSWTAAMYSAVGKSTTPPSICLAVIAESTSLFVS